MGETVVPSLGIPAFASQGSSGEVSAGPLRGKGLERRGRRAARTAERWWALGPVPGAVTPPGEGSQVMTARLTRTVNASDTSRRFLL